MSDRTLSDDPEAVRKRAANPGPRVPCETLIVKLPPGTLERALDRGLDDGLGPGQWAAGVLLRELGEAGATDDHQAEIARLRAACEFAVQAIGRQTQFWADPILARVVMDLEAALGREQRP